MEDSSKFIKGIKAKDPDADMMLDSDSFIAANPRSLLELDRPPKSIPMSEAGLVKELCHAAVMFSCWGTGASRCCRNSCH